MHRWCCLVVFLLLVFPASCLSQSAADQQEMHTDSLEEQIALGKKIFREGLLANGEPLVAYVMGDVEVLGTQFTCLDCHGRSGMGGAEGKTFTLAINPDALFNMREDMYLERSAYDDETLEDSIRLGKTPEGSALSPAMPVYDLPEREMKALIAYLKNLSGTLSPGVTDDKLHVATVISDQVDPLVKKAMLDVLQAFFTAKNAKTRLETKRQKLGPFYQHYRLKAYREWVLHVWELHGDSDTWAEQLRQHYEKQPIFSLIGGVVSGSWQPIHGFAENNGIPSLLPNTDQPGGIGSDDFYTLYFSGGLNLEARVIVADLSKSVQQAKILQVFREKSDGAFGAESLIKAVGRLESLSAASWQLQKDEVFSSEILQQKIEEEKADTVILWLGPEDLQAVGLDRLDRAVSGYIYLSSSLLGGILSPLIQPLGSRVKLVHPFFKPEDQKAVFARIKSWLERNNIALNHPRILGQSFYACMMLGEGLMHIKRHFYRDYLLDALDHANAKAIFSVNYPRLSFGPAQRYLSKGAFVITNPQAATQETPAPADWIVPYF